MQTGDYSILRDSERRLLFKHAILSFKLHSWEVRRFRPAGKLSNLSLYVLLLLYNSNPLLRSNIMHALKSNYNDIENALKPLILNNLITSEIVFEGRMNNIITAKTNRYRITSNGLSFVEGLLDDLNR